MKKRILSLVLIPVLLLTLLPLVPRAGAASVYPVWIGGTQITDTNKANLPVSGGTASFDPAKNTLTLNGVTGVNGLHRVSGEDCMIYAEGVDLTVNGSAVLSSGDAEYGIRVSGGALTLRADLTLSCGSCALRASELLLAGCTILSPGDARIYAGRVYRGNSAPAPSVKIVVTPPILTAQPSDVEALPGESVRFRVLASGIGLRYQWQSSADSGKTWKALSGRTQNELTFTASDETIGSRYRCLVSNTAGTVPSEAALLAPYLPPSVTEQPADVSAKLGASASFRVKVTGSDLSYQWEYSLNNGGSWKDWSGMVAATLPVKGKASNNGCLYRCRISNRGGSVLSEAARLTVPDAKPLILVQPGSAVVTEGGTAVFRVAAGGSGLSYQWQSSKDGGSTWTSLSGKVSASLAVVGRTADNGLLYRCTVKNSAGSVTSASAKLTVEPKPVTPVIHTQPADLSLKTGASGTFRVSAAGSGLYYQWYYSHDNGGTWKKWSGRTAASLSVTGKSSNNGCLYRCVITNSVGTVTTRSARLTVTDAAPYILSQPEDVSAALGASASFAVTAQGPGLRYQWYYSHDNGGTWKIWSGKTAAALQVTGKASNNGCLYRCLISNTYESKYTNAVRLTVTDAAPVILCQPKDLSVELGKTTAFTVTAFGTGLSFQWYYSLNGGSSWAKWSGRTAASLQVTGKTSNHNCLYHCVISNAYGSVCSRDAKLTVGGVGPGILTEPKDVSVRLDNTVTLTVQAEGDGLSYQWYYSHNDGVSWKKWSGKTAASLTLTGKTSNNGCLYRCTVSNDKGSVTSRAARLTVTNAPPIFLTQPKSITAASGTTQTFHVKVWGSGVTYQWYYSLDGGANWAAWDGKTSPDLTVTASAETNGALYRCFVYNAFGVATSETAKLTVS